MSALKIAQPDVTLLLDSQGVIQEATLSKSLELETVGEWIGRRWDETVVDAGADKVRRMVDDARTSRVSVFRQITQRFPSGLELLMEYTTVRLGGNAGLLAIGKSLQAVADLQFRLIAAQQAMERDYWKLREVETRYRLLFEASNEAVLLVRADNLQVVEANPAAREALGLEGRRFGSPNGNDLSSVLAERELPTLQTMLERVRQRGKAPAILLHLGPQREPWIVRASLMSSEPGPVFLLQLAPGGRQVSTPMRPNVPSEELIERVPDGFVVIDRQGVVVRANRAFLEMIDVGSEAAVVGQPLGRWLGRPGADLPVLLATVLRRGLVRLFATNLSSEHGNETEVEISATVSAEEDPQHVGLLLRDISRRIASPNGGDRLDAAIDGFTEQVGKTTLRQLIADTVTKVERRYIEAALDVTRGNRTAAAELLGLSRQSLYVKLNRYGFDGDEDGA